MKQPRLSVASLLHAYPPQISPTQTPPIGQWILSPLLYQRGIGGRKIYKHA